MILLREQRRCWLDGAEQSALWVGGERIWQRPSVAPQFGIADMYGNGLGEIPIHFTPEAVTLNTSGNITVAENLGGLGSAYNGTRQGSSQISINSEELFQCQGSNGYLIFPTPISLIGKRLYFVGDKDEAQIGDHKFMGANIGAAAGQRTNVNWIADDSGFRLTWWNGTAIQNSGIIPSPFLRRSQVNLIEIEVSSSLIKLFVNGLYQGETEMPWANFNINRIFGAYSNPGFVGVAGDVLFFNTDGSEAMNERAAIISAELMAKRLIQPA